MEEERKECLINVTDHLGKKLEIGGVLVNKHGRNPNDLLMWSDHFLEVEYGTLLRDHDYNLEIKYRDNWPIEVNITLFPKRNSC